MPRRWFAPPPANAAWPSVPSIQAFSPSPAPQQLWRTAKAHMSRKTISLILLVVQNSVLIMTMRYSRILSSRESGRRYIVSTAVLLVEVVKLVASLALAAHDMHKAHPSARPAEIAVLVARSLRTPGSWRLAVPALLYTVQNYLIYVAVGNMETVSFQVTYQLKILTTVVFSILLLGKTIAPRQWLALVLLTLGVVIVQTSESVEIVAPPRSLEVIKYHVLSMIRGPAGDTTKAVEMLVTTPVAVGHASHGPHPPPGMHHPSRGLAAAIAAAVISGLTSVYFEKLIKESSPVSLWTRNVQLSLFSLVPAVFLGVLWKDQAAIARHGFFSGYNVVVWATIALQALGGLLVAVCIAYADNVAKNFAASLSMVVSCVAGSVLFMDPLTIPSTAGTIVVLLAMYLYQSHNQPPATAILPLSTLSRDQASKGYT